MISIRSGEQRFGEASSAIQRTQRVPRVRHNTGGLRICELRRRSEGLSQPLRVRHIQGELRIELAASAIQGGSVSLRGCVIQRRTARKRVTSAIRETQSVSSGASGT